ncbi:ATP-dependent DNA helicase [Candidatus Micrarchaeota archaeon]|nr:ATP-dependent DNA helicase [Candidatus Micrarchaeota archaeon]
MDNIYFRHSSVRKFQNELINDVYETVSNRQHLVAHAPTGTGKSDAVLSSALTYALQNNLTIFFLTPKISQHKIALEVVKGIAEKYNLNARAIDMVGRRYACIDETLSDLDHEGFYFSCEKKRKTETCEYYGNARGYSTLQEAKAHALFEKLIQNYGAAKTHSEMIALGKGCSACPYEFMLKTASIANVVIADYYHLMIPQIRDIFLLKIKKKIENSIIIIDEAHNLAKRVRDHLSSTINTFLLVRAEKEIRLIGAEKLEIYEDFNKWAKDQLKSSREILVSKDLFTEFLKSYKTELDELILFFETAGNDFIERTNKKSACIKISKFLKDWLKEEKGSIRVLRKLGDGGYYALVKKFLDPSIATSFLNNSHSTILMSGTLLPLEMHRDVIGLDLWRTRLKKYKSPFAENNSINLIVEGVTTKYSKRSFELYTHLASKIDKIINSSPDGVALFFPSYKVLNSVVPLMGSKDNLLVQREKMTPSEVAALIRKFKDGGILCGVQGGSLSEGVDYANEEIKTAVIVGIALEEPSLETTALIDYYQEKYGKGWEYGYTYPAVIKAVQAAGRGIRKETDRAAIVFMDERFNWKNYKSILEDGRRFIVTSEPEKYVKNFWGENQISNSSSNLGTKTS